MTKKAAKSHQSAANGDVQPTVMEIIAQEETSDRKFARIALGLAVMFHIFIFAITWPSFAGASSEAKEKKQKIYVVKQVKFRQPPPRQEQQILKPRTQRVPIPDPTPDQPEPIREEQPAEDVDFVPDENLVLGVPEAPPPPEPEGPIRFVVGGKVTEPVRTGGPNPAYPEAARRARISGTVVLECVIGKDGHVESVKVLKGLPLGLTEAATDAVQNWLFKPSTLNGKPVEVLYILTVKFNLQ